MTNLQVLVLILKIFVVVVVLKFLTTTLNEQCLRSIKNCLFIYLRVTIKCLRLKLLSELFCAVRNNCTKLYRHSKASYIRLVLCVFLN